MSPGGRDLGPAPTARLAVTRLTLSDFRCYGTLRLTLDPRPVVLTGPNGAGKTNLLEALSYLAPGAGLRRAALGDVARRPGAAGGAWAVAATLATPRGRIEIGTGRAGVATTEGSRSDRRTVRIDGATARGPVALAEILGVLWLTPDMDRLFTEAASRRRRFLDRIVQGFEAAHAARVGAYESAMRQRLKLLRTGAGDTAWLAALEHRMAESAVAIAAARRTVVARLDQACALGIGPFPRATLRVAGLVEDWLEDRPALAAEEALRDRLAAARDEDGQRGRTGAGPHRSDLIVHDRSRNLPAETLSTGEQKALLIAIVLATARLQALTHGAAPLLLLDEITAHLDEGRRGALFAEITALGAQAWLTGTETGLFSGLADTAQFLGVADATVTANGMAAPRTWKRKSE